MNMDTTQPISKYQKYKEAHTRYRLSEKGQATIKKCSKEWHEKNRERMNKHKLEKYHSNNNLHHCKCGKIVKETGLNSHIKTKFHQRCMELITN